MKLCFVIIITVTVSFTSMSQAAWNIFAGPQLTSAHYTIQGVRQDNTSKIGFQAGVSSKVPFENQLSFSAGAFSSIKGYKVKFNRSAFPPDLNAVDNNTSIFTIEIAALLQFDFRSQPNHFFIKAGPSLDFQIIGREKFKLANGTTQNQEMPYGFANYGRYAANLLAHFGYETSKGLIVFVQYTRGLTSLNNADGGPQILHRAYGIAIGRYLYRRRR